MSDEQLLRTIESRIRNEERISFEEGVFLDEKTDLMTLGRLANIVRERKNGNFAYYNTNVHLRIGFVNDTNHIQIPFKLFQVM